MNVEIRSCRQDEISPFLKTCDAAFGKEVKDEEVQRYSALVRPERLFGAFDGEEWVGTAGAYEFKTSIPGGELPTAGVTMVGVLPSHRRKGILTRLMKRQMEDARQHGEALATLFASEEGIYQRFGYGIAAFQGSIDMEKDRAVFLNDPGRTGRVRLIEIDEAVKTLSGIYERARAQRPGMFARSKEWWTNHRLADPEMDREGGGPLFRAVWEDEGRADAYALYRVHQRWGDDNLPAGRVDVHEAVGTSHVATREIWRFLFGVDLITRVNASLLPVDSELLLMMLEPARLRFRLALPLWLRIVDVERALTARSYNADGSVVLELSDPFCPWNEGRWALDATPTDAALSASSKAPDLRLGASELAAVYLGGLSFTQLRNAGRVEEVRSGAARRADTLFATEQAPWCPEIF